MRDVTFVVLVIAFFAVATAHVRACGSVVEGDRPTDLDDHDGVEVGS